MACGAKIVKNRIRQQYPRVFERRKLPILKEEGRADFSAFFIAIEVVIDTLKKTSIRNIGTKSGLPQ